MLSASFLLNEVQFKAKKFRIEMNHWLYQSPELDRRIISKEEEAACKRYAQQHNKKTGKGGILISLRTNHPQNKKSIGLFVNSTDVCVPVVLTQQENPLDDPVTPQYFENNSLLDNYFCDSSTVKTPTDAGINNKPETVAELTDSIISTSTKVQVCNVSTPQKKFNELLNNNGNNNSNINCKLNGDIDNNNKEKEAQEHEHEHEAIQDKSQTSIGGKRSFKIEDLFRQFHNKRRLLKESFKQRRQASKDKKKKESNDDATGSTNCDTRTEGTYGSCATPLTDYRIDVMTPKGLVSEPLDFNDNKSLIDISETENKITKDIKTNERENQKDKNKRNNNDNNNPFRFRRKASSTSTNSSNSSHSWKNVFNEVSKNAALISTGNKPQELAKLPSADGKGRIKSDFTDFMDYGNGFKWTSFNIETQKANDKKKKKKKNNKKRKNNSHNSKNSTPSSTSSSSKINNKNRSTLFSQGKKILEFNKEFNNGALIATPCIGDTDKENLETQIDHYVAIDYEKYNIPTSVIDQLAVTLKESPLAQLSLIPGSGPFDGFIEERTNRSNSFRDSSLIGLDKIILK